MKFLVLLGVLIPFLTPLCFNLYIAFMPGYTVGDANGWLGYLGGYSGGFLAFISAYWLFRQEKKQAGKCWLRVRTEETTKESIKTCRYSVIYYSKSSEPKFDCIERKDKGWGEYAVIKVSIKNVSVNYAKSISLSIVPHIGARVNPHVHFCGGNGIAVFPSIAELEHGEVFQFTIHVDPKFFAQNNPVEFRLISKGLEGSVNEQTLYLHQSTMGDNGMSFEN
ncbi:hypothetical protein CCZ37_17230 [Vibrio qinghaiensis]|uniref:Uncharacterized protein n=1 Tax=Vibrio qinghaiensis TaxID=2025808 RepID=A0A223N363_9VIBR|nr:MULTISPECIES: hypothetical protein [Vibrio]ASU24208.1 hypothetical protein CCZ37_17230 [Vibrio qinghaiensis]MBH9742375.1 hypothetical protein [Vibrio navarrensis]